MRRIAAARLMRQQTCRASRRREGFQGSASLEEKDPVKYRSNVDAFASLRSRKQIERKCPTGSIIKLGRIFWATTEH